MKKLLIAGLLILKLIPSYSQSDSSRTYVVLKWKLDRLLDAYAYDLPKCGQTVVKLDSAVQSLKMTVQASEKLTAIRTIERDIQVRINEKSDSIARNTSVIHKADIKAERKKGWKKGAVGLVLGFVLAAVFL